MLILVINSGSSSIKYKLFEDTNELYSGIKEEVKDYKHSLDEIFSQLTQKNLINDLSDIDAIGHRVVHGGEKFSQAACINQEVIEDITSLIPLAPLHNPVNLEAIQIIHKFYPNIPQVAVFDTAFHQSIPKENYIYPIKKSFYEQNHIRKYGFHGTSHDYVAKKTAQALNLDIDASNFITLHLGNGASVCAIKDGKSYDTSMGFTPLDGLMMGTRCGTIDPAIIFYMEKFIGMQIEEIDKTLNKESGFKGLCGKSDLREVLKDVENSDSNAILALDIFVKRIQQYIANYFIQLQKVDGIIFTGGIGEHSNIIREKVCENLGCINVYINKDKNENLTTNDVDIISSQNSKIPIIVTNTNEELEIAIQTKLCISSSNNIIDKKDF